VEEQRLNALICPKTAISPQKRHMNPAMKKIFLAIAISIALLPAAAQRQKKLSTHIERLPIKPSKTIRGVQALDCKHRSIPAESSVPWWIYPPFYTLENINYCM
jgi:hypothetical protein